MTAVANRLEMCVINSLYSLTGFVYTLLDILFNMQFKANGNI